jgi:hypothetical protein
MSYQAMEKHGGNAKACYHMKEVNMKMHELCFTPTILHSGKSNHGYNKEINWLLELGGGTSEWGEHRVLLGQNYHYNGGFRSLCKSKQTKKKL